MVSLGIFSWLHLGYVVSQLPRLIVKLGKVRIIGLVGQLTFDETTRKEFWRKKNRPKTENLKELPEKTVSGDFRSGHPSSEMNNKRF